MATAARLGRPTVANDRIRTAHDPYAAYAAAAA